MGTSPLQGVCISFDLDCSYAWVAYHAPVLWPFFIEAPRLRSTHPSSHSFDASGLGGPGRPFALCGIGTSLSAEPRPCRRGVCLE